MTSAFNQPKKTFGRRKWVAVILCVIVFAGIALLFFSKNANEQTMKVVTEYYDFYYPMKWKNNLSTEERNGSVTFYGLVEDQGEIPLFRFSFCEGNGTLIGSVQTKAGERTNVYLTIYPQVPDGVWSQKQLNVIYSMGEDLNFLLDKMTLEEGISSAAEPDQTGVFEDNMIHTPYGMLYYPGNWNSSLKIKVEEGEQYTVSFYFSEKDPEQIRLFDICIGKESEGAIGRRKLNDGTYAYVKVIHYAVEEEWLSKTQLNTILDMIDAVNYSLEKLSVEKFQENPVADAPMVSTTELVLNTPYADLKYPAEWEDMLRIKTISGKVYTVAFYGKVGEMDELHLFDIVFGDTEEKSIGTLLSKKNSPITVGVNMYPVSYSDSLTEDQKNNIFAMQDALNDIVGNLQLLESFEFTEEENCDDETDGAVLAEDVVFETPYGQLNYPAKWANLIRAEEEADDAFSVSYWGNIGGEEYHLFTIIFGCTEDMAIGTIEDGCGHTVCVGIDLSDPPKEGVLTQENKTVFYEMQEDANYMIGMLDIK